jgi:AbrB family looped-hinge helix DNA binding protein
MEQLFRGKVTDAGRVVIPVELRKAFGLGEGDEVLFSRDDRGIRITPVSLAIEEAQDFFSSLAPAEVVTSHDVPGEGHRQEPRE